MYLKNTEMGAIQIYIFFQRRPDFCISFLHFWGLIAYTNRGAISVLFLLTHFKRLTHILQNAIDRVNAFILFWYVFIYPVLL